jgi:putative phosphoesterase
MKWLIVSDIHGSAYYCRRALETFEREGAERLLLLGDVLYHGPRNDLPEEYDTRKTAALLNSIDPPPLCVRGNCDGEVDQMVLAFPVLADFAAVFAGGKTLFLSHGHHLEEAAAPLKSGDVVLFGHTHVPELRRDEKGVICVNPGSVSLPKNGTPHAYLVCEDGALAWKDVLTGETWKTAVLT